jgi:hypothetical protein
MQLKVPTINHSKLEYTTKEHIINGLAKIKWKLPKALSLVVIL